MRQLCPAATGVNKAQQHESLARHGPTLFPSFLPVQITDLLGASGSERVLLREDKQAGVFLEGVSWHAVTKGEEG